MQQIFESLLMTGAKNCENWWMCVKAIDSQTWDIFLRQCKTAEDFAVTDQVRTVIVVKAKAEQHWLYVVHDTHRHGL